MASGTSQHCELDKIKRISQLIRTGYLVAGFQIQLLQCLYNKICVTEHMNIKLDYNIHTTDY